MRGSCPECASPALVGPLPGLTPALVVPLSGLVGSLCPIAVLLEVVRIVRLLPLLGRCPDWLLPLLGRCPDCWGSLGPLGPPSVAVRVAVLQKEGMRGSCPDSASPALLGLLYGLVGLLYGLVGLLYGLLSS